MSLSYIWLKTQPSVSALLGCPLPMRVGRKEGIAEAGRNPESHTVSSFLVIFS